MCTVTFIARRNGYALGMNRDEQRTRMRGLPPAWHSIQNRKVVGPSEPGGGMWIALNNSGVTLALINWYSISARVKAKPLSRGLIVKATSAAPSPYLANAILQTLPVRRINPFRLIGIFPAEQVILEWRWNLEHVVSIEHRWKTQQWISSGYDESTAQQVRGKTFRLALKQRTAGSRSWLRRLHRSHLPVAGPFSTCMHRADAVSVSYTEVSVFRRQAILQHHNSSPCQCDQADRRTIQIRLSES